MTPADIAKPAGSGPFKGKPRKKIFDLKIKAKSPFLLNDGKNNLTPVQGIKWDEKTNTLTAKLGTKTFTTSLKYIVKDVDFGGQPTKKDEGGESGTTTDAINSGGLFQLRLVEAAPTPEGLRVFCAVPY